MNHKKLAKTLPLATIRDIKKLHVQLVAYLRQQPDARCECHADTLEDKVRQMFISLDTPMGTRTTAENAIERGEEEFAAILDEFTKIAKQYNMTQRIFA